MAPNWRVISFAPKNQAFVMPSGAMAPESETPILADPVQHWADPELAISWLIQARRWLDDKALFDQLNAPPNLTDLAANRAMKARQTDFVGRPFYAIAKAFDAMNLVAMNDPVGRYLHHEFVSGAPFGETDAEQLTSWFAKETNFGGGFQRAGRPQEFGRWFVPNQRTPIFGEQKALAPAGSIAKKARNGFLNFYPRGARVASGHPNNFGQFVGIRLAADRQQQATLAAVQYQKYVVNQAYVFRNFSEAQRGTLDDYGGVLVTPGDNIGNRGKGVMPDGTILPPAPSLNGSVTTLFWDWRATFFDEWPTVFGIESDPNGRLDLTPPMMLYLELASRWVDACLARGVNQIIEDTRRFVTWANYQQVRQAGSIEQFLADATNKDGDVLRQQLARDTGIQAASGIILAAGTGLAAATYGISALVAGVATAVLQAIDFATDGEVRGYGKDEFGNYKPNLLRAMLSGDITRPDAGLGAPRVSDLVDPPIGRQQASIDWATAFANIGPQLLINAQLGGYLKDQSWGELDHDPTAPKKSSILPWAIGAVAVGVGAAVVVDRRKKSKKNK